MEPSEGFISYNHCFSQYSHRKMEPEEGFVSCCIAIQSVLIEQTSIPEECNGGSRDKIEFISYNQCFSQYNDRYMEPAEGFISYNHWFSYSTTTGIWNLQNDLEVITIVQRQEYGTFRRIYELWPLLQPVQRQEYGTLQRNMDVNYDCIYKVLDWRCMLPQLPKL